MNWIGKKRDESWELWCALETQICCGEVTVLRILEWPSLWVCSSNLKRRSKPSVKEQNLKT